MNCIQPTAPAELGPMFRPKFDSILLIAPSTDHGIPYAWPARRQSAWRSVVDRSCGATGGVLMLGGIETWPGAFGASALGSDTGRAVRGAAAWSPAAEGD